MSSSASSASSGSSSSGDLSDSDLDSYESKSYSFLETTASAPTAHPNHRLHNPDGSFRCPFCAGKKKQSFVLKDLLQHATGIAASSARKPSLRATHAALARFLKIHHPLAPLAASDPPPPPRDSDPNPSTKKPDRSPEDRFVWPWTGVLANVPIGHPLDDAFSKFHPVEFTPLIVNPGDCACSVIVRFNRDWSGFRDAVAFENHFKAAGFGREEWVKGKFEVGKGDLYGWMGREEDFDGDGEVGECLRRSWKVVTVSEVESEEARENGKMVAMLASQIEVKNQHLMDMECRYNLRDLSLKRLMEEKNMLHMAFNESNGCFPLLSSLYTFCDVNC